MWQPLGPSSRTGEVLSLALGSGTRPRGRGVAVPKATGSCCRAPESPEDCASDAFRVGGRRRLVQDV
ncbi:hypothetical protein NDU88_008626 [Pleurodeles waltl]|uniref:Uncharacterized protein n=1 Tax=Pleurodeles waltl TaxID=8319 RepID=A0AAV7PPN6_PLEWA|nr:hypothetical protein NDU88_008626 [Pleurodeles waltl]